ncbi:energy-coupling factor ABC transporter ATP-binding protein [Halonatronum saccharophilum]|uniref:energy-coupling factor ABC transporter ATP-binding protein n=1 Tax=Halonatronum saccharophilum TaxID=150060 RepID=UPI00047FD9C2|nr:ATP-binding cassette domain-containing protein [Halonatronum saccharophilum]
MRDILRGEDIVKYYGGEKILDIGGIRIKKGRILALMGPNGSGKTTLIKVLSFLEQRDGGEIYYQGERVEGKGILNLRRRVGFVWQKPLLYRGSVYDNIALGLKYRKIERKNIRRKVDEILTRLRIDSLRDKQARSLSGGEQQKVSFARTLVSDPNLIFIDEPNTSLDMDSILLMEDIIKEERKKGVSILLITHNLYQARELADEILLLKDGVIIDQGGAEEIFVREQKLLKYL